MIQYFTNVIKKVIMNNLYHYISCISYIILYILFIYFLFYKYYKNNIKIIKYVLRNSSTKKT